MKELKRSFCKLPIKAKILLIAIITIWALITVALVQEIDSVNKISKYLSRLATPEIILYSGVIFIGREFFVRFGKISNMLTKYQGDSKRSFRLIDVHIDRHQESIKKIIKDISEIKTELETIKEILKNGKS